MRQSNNWMVQQVEFITLKPRDWRVGKQKWQNNPQVINQSITADIKVSKSSATPSIIRPATSNYLPPNPFVSSGRPDHQNKTLIEFSNLNHKERKGKSKTFSTKQEVKNVKTEEKGNKGCTKKWMTLIAYHRPPRLHHHHEQILYRPF